MLEQITPIILTYDEEPNIGRTLDALKWAKTVIVIDSFSSDRTAEIVRSHSNTRLHQRKFDNFANQWNYALGLADVQTQWVLALDADYLLGDDAVAELKGLKPSPDVVGYEASFRYCIGGQSLRGSLYPPVTVLFRNERALFTQDGHAYRVKLEGGKVERLQNAFLHDDRKALPRWLASQARYAREESVKLRASSWSELKWADRVRKVPFLSAAMVLPYCLIAKGCILDGRAGLAYTAQRSLAELILTLRNLDPSD